MIELPEWQKINKAACYRSLLEERRSGYHLQEYTMCICISEVVYVYRQIVSQNKGEKRRLSKSPNRDTSER